MTDNGQDAFGSQMDRVEGLMVADGQIAPTTPTFTEPSAGPDLMGDLTKAGEAYRKNREELAGVIGKEREMGNMFNVPPELGDLRKRLEGLRKNDISLGQSYDLQLLRNMDDPSIANDPQSMMEMLDEWTHIRFNIKTTDGAVWNGGERFENAMAYWNTIQSRLRNGYRSIASDRYNRWMDAVESGDREKMISEAGISKKKMVEDIGADIPMTGGMTAPLHYYQKEVDKTEQEIQQEIDAHDMKIRGENFVSLYQALGYDFNDEDKKAIEAAVENHDGLPKEWEGYLYGEIKFNPDKAERICTLIQASRNKRQAFWGDTAHAFGDGLKRLGLFNRDYGAGRFISNTWYNWISDEDDSPEAKVDNQLSRKDEIEDRKAFLMVEDAISSQPATTYGWFKKGLIDLAATTPYMAMTSIPYGVGDAFNVMGQLENVKDSIIMAGGDPDYAQGFQVASAIAWAAVEHLEASMVFGKPLSGVGKRLRVASFLRNADFKKLGHILVTGERDAIIKTFGECSQEGIQQVIEDATVSLATARDPRGLNRDFSESFTTAFVDSLASMGILSHAGVAGRGVKNMHDFRDYTPIPEYADKLMKAQNVAAKYSYDPEGGEDKKRSSVAMNRWSEIWLKTPNKKDAQEQIREEFGLTKKEAEMVSDFMAFRDETVEAVKKIDDPAVRQRMIDNIVLREKNAFSENVSDDDTDYDPVSLLKVIDPNIKVEDSEVEVPMTEAEIAAEDKARAEAEERAKTETNVDTDGGVAVSPAEGGDVRNSVTVSHTTSPTVEKTSGKEVDDGTYSPEKDSDQLERTAEEPVSPSPEGAVKEGGEDWVEINTETGETKVGTSPDEDSDFSKSEPRMKKVPVKIVTVPIVGADGNVVERKYTIMEQTGTPDITTESFAQSVEEATGGVITADEYLSIPDDEKEEFLVSQNLKQGGTSRILDEKGREVFKTDGLIQIARSQSQIVKTGGNWTLTHEHGHFLAGMAKAMGVFGDTSDADYDPSKNENVQIMRKVFGNPTGKNELFNEERFANTLADYINGKWDPDDLQDARDNEVSVIRAIFDALKNLMMKAYSYVTGRSYEADKIESISVRDLQRQILESVRHGDFRLISQLNPEVVNALTTSDVSTDVVEMTEKRHRELEEDVRKEQAKDSDAITNAENRLAEGSYSETEGEEMKKDVRTVAEAGAVRHSVSSMMKGVGITWEKFEDGSVAVYHPGTKIRVDKKHPLKGSELRGEGTPMYRLFQNADIIKVDADEIDGMLENYAEMMNKAVDYIGTDVHGLEYLDTIWRWAASSVFKSVKSNADSQYSLSIDMTTICKKTEMVLNAVSEFQVKHGRGCTPSEIIQIFLKTGEAGFQTPCPCCYVFAHWLRAGLLYQTMWMAQNHFNGMIKTIEEYRAMTPQQQEEYREFWRKRYFEEKRFAQDNKKEIKAAKEMIDSSYVLLDKVMAVVNDETKKRDAGLKYSQEAIDKGMEIVDKLTAQISDAYQLVARSDYAGWIKNNVADFKQTSPKDETLKKGEFDFNATYDVAIRDDYRYVPQDILFAFNRSDELVAGYPGAARFRSSKGSGAGKGIETDANNEVGEVISGLAEKLFNPFVDEYKKTAKGKLTKLTDKSRNTEIRNTIKKAMLWAIRQRLRGGQRVFSWSDNLMKFGPDMFLNFLQLQIIGASVQSYSKQLEGVELIVSMGGYNNGSLMAQGSGFEVVEVKEGEEVPKDAVLLNGKYYRLLFSDVQGIDADELFKLNEKYDKSGNILVGMSDQHIKIALLDKRIKFVIPWHSSSLRKEWMYRMMEMLGETSDVDADDYQPLQNDSIVVEGGKKMTSENMATVNAFWHKMEGEINSAVILVKDKKVKVGKFRSCFDVSLSDKGVSADQKKYRDLRTRIMRGKATKDDIELAEKDEFLGKIVKKLRWAAEENKASLSKRDVSNGLLKMQEKDVDSIFPYEYWDENSTEDSQDINGWRYLEYCRRLGAIPKFSGLNTSGEWVRNADGEVYGQFYNLSGYCKVLIDRRMYKNDGTYQDTDAVDTKGFQLDFITKEGILSKWGKHFTKNADPKQASGIADKVEAMEKNWKLHIDTLDNSVDREKYIKKVQEYLSKEYKKANGDFSSMVDKLYDDWLGRRNDIFSKALANEKAAKEQKAPKKQRASKAKASAADARNSVTREQAQYDEVVAKYKDTDQWMKAPNGKPTKLSERQWVQVRTPNFKNWFGDWENDPENASKVVDENGEPMVVYHGTRMAEFWEFDETYNSEYENVKDRGFFFSNSIEMARSYSGTEAEIVHEEDPGDVYSDTDAEYVDKEGIDRVPGLSVRPGVYAVFLNIKNPVTVPVKGDWNDIKMGEKNSNLVSFDDLEGEIQEKIVKEMIDDGDIDIEIEEDEDGTWDNYYDISEAVENYYREFNAETDDDGNIISLGDRPLFNKETGEYEDNPEWVTTTRDFSNANLGEGNDGIIFENVADYGPFHPRATQPWNNVYVIPKDTQVKSATENTGAYGNEESDIRYSVTRDSEGNELSEEQVEFFKDSKIREKNEDAGFWDDEYGALKPVYHASQGDKFTTFDREKLGYNTLDNSGDSWMQATSMIGFWFNSQDLSKNGSSYDDGDSWSHKVYLDITTPYEIADLGELSGAIMEVYNEAHSDDEDFDYSETPYDSDTAIEAGKLFVEWLKDEGYDGVVVLNDEEFGGTSYVALDSNQAKEVDNRKPTIDSDIRNSLVRGKSYKSPEDVVTGFLASQILGGKKVPLESVERRLKNTGATSADPKVVLENARKIAERRKKRAVRGALSEDKDLVKSMIDESMRNRLFGMIGDAVTKGASAADPDIGRVMENTARKRQEKSMASAKGFTAAEMQAEMPIDLVSGMYAVTEYNSKQKIPLPKTSRPKADQELDGAEDDYREPTAEEQEYYNQLLKRSEERSEQDKAFEDKIREKKAKKEEERQKNNEFAKAAREDPSLMEEKEADDDSDDDSGNPDFDMDEPTIKRISAVFNDPFLFAGFVIEWTMDHVLKKHEDIKDRKDIWKNPVAMKELAETAKHILQTLCNRTLGSSLSVRKYLEDRIASSEDPERFANIRKLLNEKGGFSIEASGIKVLLDSRINKIATVRDYQQMKVLIADTYEAVRDYAIKTSGSALIKKLKKIGDALAKDGKLFKATKELGSRKTGAKVERWWRKVRSALTMTDYAIEQKHTIEMGVILQHTLKANEHDEETSPYYENELKYNDAKDWVAVLSQFGGLKYKTPGEIADKMIIILDNLIDGREQFERERDEHKRVCGDIRNYIVEAIIDGGKNAKHGEQGLIGKVADSLVGSLRMRLEHMIADCKDEAKRRNALKAIEEIMIMVSRSSAQLKVVESEANEELNRGLASCYGSAENGLRHLNEELPKNVADKIFKQRKRGKAPTYSNLLQLYGSCIQIDYKNNIKEHGRDKLIADMREALSPGDILFHSFAVQWYRDNRAALSDAVEKITGLPVYSPDKFYIPVRMLSERTGLSTEMRNWTPIPSALSLRVRNKLDFDESVGILETLQEQAGIRAEIMARTGLGITLRDILGHEDMKKAARQYLPEGELSRINKQVLDILIGGLSGSDPINAMINLGRAGLARGYLSYNFESAIKQLTSFPVWANYLGFRKLTRYMFDISPQAISELKSHAGYKARYVAGWSEETQNVLRHPGTNPVSRLLAKFYDFGMKPLSFVDSVASLWLGQGIYREAVAKNLDMGFSEKEAKERAASLVWGFVEESQQSGREEYLTNLQRRMPGLVGLIWHFLTSPLQQQAFEIEAIRETVKGTPGAKKRLARAIIINHVLVPSLMHLVSAGIGTLLGEEPEEPEDGEVPQWVKELAVEMILGQSAPLFIVTNLIEDLSNKLLGVKPKFRSSGGVAIEGVVRIAQDGFKFLVDCGKYGVQELDGYDFDVTPEEIGEDFLKFIGDVFAPARMYRKYRKNHEDD